MVDPLTGPEIEVIPAHTTIVGVRFQPGTAPPLPTVLDDLVDQRLGLGELWGSAMDRLEEAMAGAETPQQALVALQARLRHEFRSAVSPDPLVREAVQALMPWHPVNVDTLATHLALSPSQLRRRCLHAVGMSPKVLQRTLRFQGFLALAQARATASGRRGADGVAGLAVDVGSAARAKSLPRSPLLSPPASGRACCQPPRGGTAPTTRWPGCTSMSPAAGGA